MRSERLVSHGQTLHDGFQWPACPVCGDMLLAAVSSVLVERGHIRHLWACETCGYSFPTAVRLQATDDDDQA